MLPHILDAIFVSGLCCCYNIRFSITNTGFEYFQLIQLSFETLYASFVAVGSGSQEIGTIQEWVREPRTSLRRLLRSDSCTISEGLASSKPSLIVII